MNEALETAVVALATTTCLSLLGLATAIVVLVLGRKSDRTWGVQVAMTCAQSFNNGYRAGMSAAAGAPSLDGLPMPLGQAQPASPDEPPPSEGEEVARF